MERFRATTSWTAVELTSEPYIVQTAFGYIAAVKCRAFPEMHEFELLIGSIRSLAQGIEPLRVANDGRFSGIRCKIRKETTDRSSRYLIDNGGAEGATSEHDAVESSTGKSPSNEDRLWQRIIRQNGP